MKKLYLLLAASLLTAGLTGCASASSNGQSPQNLPASGDGGNSHPAAPAVTQAPLNTSATGYASHSIKVNSSEKVTATPDIAEVVYSVRTEAKEAADCQQQNAQSVSQVISLLTSLNVAESSIQTSDYYMNPVYDYSGNRSRIVGYEAITSLTVSDLPIDGLEQILAQSVAGGINTIQSIAYKASKYDESYQAALTAAVQTARQKAQVLADAAGCQVGPVVNIQETSGYSEARYNDSALANQYRSSAKLMSVEDTAGSIMPGEIQVEASIVVEYALIN
ncbi:MAG: SIMPL domain-containing protein [Clostridium sp.]|nr:SIMPL domain-containing protein [Clostridium sp.]